MADEDHRPAADGVDQLDHVVGIALQAGVLAVVVGRQVRMPGADQVEQYHAVITREAGRQLAPHVLVAAEAVREHQRRRAAGRVAADVDVVALQGIHGARRVAALLSERGIVPAPPCQRGRLLMGRAVPAASGAVVAARWVGAVGCGASRSPGWRQAARAGVRQPAPVSNSPGWCQAAGAGVRPPALRWPRRCAPAPRASACRPAPARPGWPAAAPAWRHR